MILFDRVNHNDQDQSLLVFKDGFLAVTRPVLDDPKWALGELAKEIKRLHDEKLEVPK